MENNEVLEIAKKFNINGTPENISLIESGHINKTYLVKCDTGKRYILQYVNTYVFPNINELMDNVERVTNFIKKKSNIQTITFIKTKENKPKYIYNNNWRMQEFIENTKNFLSTESLEILEEAGKAIGDFQTQLNGFNAETLFETIPKFHDTPNRVKQLEIAIESKENKEKRKERFEKAKEYIDFLTDKKRTSITDTITNKLKNGTIPTRATHNDTKLSNILFNKDTNKYVALIDLDTIMPGSIVYDFGEGIRTSSTTSREDEGDISKIHVDMNRFEAYTKGFLEKVKTIITKEELELLPLGIWMMTYENAIRFLTDYLNGDIYFAVRKEDHNLIRTKVQSEILKQMEYNQKIMEGMIKKYEL